MTKLAQTSETSISLTFLVMNLVKLLRQFYCLFLCQISQNSELASPIIRMSYVKLVYTRKTAYAGSSEVTMREIAETLTEQEFLLNCIKRKLKSRNPFPDGDYRHLPYIPRSEEPLCLTLFHFWSTFHTLFFEVIQQALH